MGGGKPCQLSQFGTLHPTLPLRKQHREKVVSQLLLLRGDLITHIIFESTFLIAPFLTSPLYMTCIYISAYDLCGHPQDNSTRFRREEPRKKRKNPVCSDLVVCCAATTSIRYGTVCTVTCTARGMVGRRDHRTESKHAINFTLSFGAPFLFVRQRFIAAGDLGNSIKDQDFRQTT